MAVRHDAAIILVLALFSNLASASTDEPGTCSTSEQSHPGTCRTQAKGDVGLGLIQVASITSKSGGTGMENEEEGGREEGGQRGKAHEGLSTDTEDDVAGEDAGDASASAGRRRRRRSKSSSQYVTKDEFNTMKKAVTEIKKKVDGIDTMKKAVTEIKNKVEAIKAAKGGAKPQPPSPRAPARSKPVVPAKKLGPGEKQITGGNDVAKDDWVRIDDKRMYNENGKWGQVTSINPFHGVKVKGKGINQNKWFKWNQVVKLPVPLPKTTTTTTTQPPNVLSAEGSVRLGGRLCLGLYKIEFPPFFHKNHEKKGLPAVKALAGETDPTQYTVFMAPCAKSNARHAIKTAGPDDPHIRWVKQPGGFYKNVKYGMCLRWPKSDGRQYADFWKGVHIGIGTTDCDPKRAGPFLEEDGLLKLFCSHHGKKKGHGLKQSECACGFYKFEPRYMAAIKSGTPKHKVYTTGMYCGNSKPLKLKEMP